MQEIKEPTGNQCNNNTVIFENQLIVRFAIWYPQMGGYCGKAIVELSKGNGCFNVYVWHDGEFPFDGEDSAPFLLHHCNAQQFITFGETLKKFGAD